MIRLLAIPREDTYGDHARIVQSIKYHLWSASNANVGCPEAMTDGAAHVLKKELSAGLYDDQTRRVLQDALNRLTSRDPTKAWTSGQWMTERRGGSDVSGTETLAAFTGSTDVRNVDGYSLGPWRIDGFKWFSSATDCDMTILLARTSKGLSCFFAPTRRLSANGALEMNGIRIQRLKSKMGTRPLPTAELEIEGMRAYLLGEEGKGVNVISGMLNITRVCNSCKTSVPSHLRLDVLIPKSECCWFFRERIGDCQRVCFPKKDWANCPSRHPPVQENNCTSGSTVSRSYAADIFRCLLARTFRKIE